ncbi:MAG: YggS family pyridoxal phosphate-dependent enzyme [Elusimicrobia bacterium]|nr:YggS family pyridoxal phosphate-dependent enzyme [Elusimicrobiota bacterium]
MLKSRIPITLFDNLKVILNRLPKGVELMVATKYAKREEIEVLLNSGLVFHVGENKVQEAERKFPQLAKFSHVQWHFIGNLQKNKAKKAIKIFSWIDSLDDIPLANFLENLAALQDTRLRVLIQVKLAEKATQHGIAPEEVGEFLKILRGFVHLEPRGLMAIAPDLEPPEKTRPYFRRMKEIFDRYFKPETLNFKPYLSMGMSRDFEIAIQEGANLIRIGSAIFKNQGESL